MRERGSTITTTATKEECNKGGWEWYCNKLRDSVCAGECTDTLPHSNSRVKGVYNMVGEGVGGIDFRALQEEL